MKARLPQGYSSSGPSNINSMIKQAQKMQDDMQKAQEELEQKEYETTVGGGAVTIKMNGKKEVLSLKINPEVVDADDVEMLEELMSAAINDIISKVESDSSKTMQEITGSMPNIPGLF